MTQNITVRGPVETDSDNYAEALIVERNGEETEVPVYDVSTSAYKEWQGDVPRSVTYTRVYVWEGRLTAEAWLHDGSLVEMHETEPGSGRFAAAHITNPSSVDEADPELWRSPLKAESELTMLVEQGLTPAEALDYWFARIQGFRVEEIGKRRGVSHQAVSENVRKAEAKLGA